MFEKELETRNTEGLASLRAALGGDDVPADKLDAFFSSVEERLTKALNARITPRAVYNKVAPPTSHLRRLTRVGLSHSRSCSVQPS